MIGFAALGDEARRAGPALVEPLLDVGLGKPQAGRRAGLWKQKVLIVVLRFLGGLMPILLWPFWRPTGWLKNLSWMMKPVRLYQNSATI